MSSGRYTVSGVYVKMAVDINGDKVVDDKDVAACQNVTVVLLSNTGTGKYPNLSTDTVCSTKVDLSTNP